jgi:hypothetical protein
VRPPEGALPDDSPDHGEVERHPEAGQLLHHRLASGFPVPTHLFETLDESRLAGVDEESEEMDVLAIAARRKLRGRNRDQAGARRRAFEFGQPVDGVVVREGEGRKARLHGAGHERRGGFDAVREDGVTVEVGASESFHPTILPAWTATPSPPPSSGSPGSSR